jgi:dihydrofolate reductase
MTKIRSHISVSLDAYAAGPGQSHENPLGRGGERLHEWAVRSAAWRRHHGMDGGEEDVDSQVVDACVENVGAYIMGRGMFGPPEGGPWDPAWTGWWGDEPPFGVPVFVLTHHPRDPLPTPNGTTFHFVTDGIEAALDRAREAAGGRDVMVAGGAKAIQQYLAAGLLDELYLHVAPVVLGGGERLLVNVGDPRLEPVEVIASPATTHIRYRVG